MMESVVISALFDPVFVILLCVEYPKYDDADADDLVEYLVGKPPENDAAKVAVVKSLAFGIQFQRPHRGGELIQKFTSQPGPFLLIPIPHAPALKAGEVLPKSLPCS